jgi:hypothetical protein
MSAVDPSNANLKELSAEERSLVASTWAFRASAERSAALRFQRLAQGLENIGAPTPIRDLTHRAVEDEVRHITICDHLACNFGWKDEPLPPTAHQAIGIKGSTHQEQLLFEIVAFCCITETINASMLLAIKDMVLHEGIKIGVQTILKDEVNHSKIGWAYLQYARNEGQGGFLPEALPQMFQGAGVEEIYTSDGVSREADHLANYGELNFKMRTDIFRASIRDVIFPGLEHMGIKTNHGRKWLSHFEPKLMQT